MLGALLSPCDSAKKIRLCLCRYCSLDDGSEKLLLSVLHAEDMNGGDGITVSDLIGGSTDGGGLATTWMSPFSWCRRISLMSGGISLCFCVYTGSRVLLGSVVDSLIVGREEVEVLGGLGTCASVDTVSGEKDCRRAELLARHVSGWVLAM